MEPFFAFPPPFDFALLREAAGRLRDAADTVGSATDLLTGTGRVPPDDFEGDAGRAYRTATDGLASDAELLGGDLRALGAALDEFAGWAEQVREVVLRIHEVADAHGIARDGYWRSLPPAATGDQTVLFHTLRNRAGEADRVLQWAEERWASALEEHAGVRPTGAPLQNHAPPTADWPPRDWPGLGPLPTPPPVEPVEPLAPREPLSVDPSAPVDRPAPEGPGGAPPDGRQDGREDGRPERDAGPAEAPPPAPPPASPPPGGNPLTPVPPSDATPSPELSPAGAPGVLGQPPAAPAAPVAPATPTAPATPAAPAVPLVPDPAETLAHDLTELLR